MIKNLLKLKNYDWDEAKTKQFIILPILANYLNWNIYNPEEVIPEYSSDIAGRKGEKVDYALQIDGKTEIIIEVKPIRTKLIQEHAHQLARYFPHSNAKLGVLSNGIDWEFYSDFERENILDEHPFLKLSLDTMEEEELRQLFKLLDRNELNIEGFLKYGKREIMKEEFKTIVEQQLADPDDDLIKLFIKKYNETHNTQYNNNQKNIQFFKQLFQLVLNENEVITEGLPIIIPDSTPPVKYNIRRGYFKNDEGTVSKTDNLKQAWIDYWKKVAENPKHLTKMRELSENQKLGRTLLSKTPILYDSGDVGNAEIADNLYILSNLSSKGRVQRLEKLSAELGIVSEIVATDSD